MRTPSIERRFVVVGTCVVAILVIALDIALYVSLRADVSASSEKVFDRQVGVVAAEGRRSFSSENLADRIERAGIRADVVAGDGRRFSSDPTGVSIPDHTRRREVVVDVGSPPIDRARVVLSIPSAAKDRRTGRLLVLQAVLTPLALLLAALILRWIAEIATRPLDEVALRARRTTIGLHGERLEPDRPATHLGQMATAYDKMLDSLEGAVAEAEAARAESDRLERRTRKILETAHEAFIVMDDLGVIIDWNAEAERMFGWPRDEILGRPWEETLIPADVRDQLEAARLESGTDHLWPYGARAAEMIAVRQDGERFPIGVTVWATEHEGVRTFNAFVRDFTERQRAEEATAHLAAIVESSDRAMLSTDPEGTVLSWNPAAERMYGYSAAEAVGQPLSSLIIPEDQRGRYEEALVTVARGEVIDSDQVMRRRKHGGPFYVAVTIAPLRDSNGKIYGACSVARDMTQEREIASQLDSSLMALAAAAEEARASEERTRRFLDDAAHQLRSPITSIRACAETLTLDITPAQRDRLLEAVVRESERASRLMAGLLRMARLGHEQALELKPAHVLALCEAEADRASLDSPQLEITASLAGPPIGQVRVAADAMVEIVSNLVDNARRHAESRIEITVQATDTGIEVRVLDDGPGVPEDQAEAVFERFVSLDNKGGSGLGLAIARELARTHGGDLTYEDRAFVLRLPAQRDPAEDDAHDAPPATGRDATASPARL